MWAVAAVERGAEQWLTHGVTVTLIPFAPAEGEVGIETQTDRKDFGDYATDIPSFEGNIVLSEALSSLDVDDGPGCVAMHEEGHAIGLDHVSEPESLMYPVMGFHDGGICFWSKADEDQF